MQHFRLYVVKESKNSRAAIGNIKTFLSRSLGDDYQLEIIDVFERPNAAERDKIVAVPTLMRVRPEPIKRLIGELTDIQQVALILGLDEDSADADALD